MFQTRLRLVAMVLVAGLLVGLAMRVVWQCRGMETAWETTVAGWREAAFGWTGLVPPPLDEREPAEQAEFWLAETERILAAHPDDAELMMGAAWLLDSPGEEFVKNYTKEAPQHSLRFYKTDDEGIARARRRFESRCHQKCIELADQAMRTDPEDVQWPRSRALLLMTMGIHMDDPAPRSDDWQSALQECSRRDPDNALYDYLAAYALWSDAGEWGDVGEDPFTPVIEITMHDPERFAKGVKAFERGLKKPRLTIGDRCGASSVTLMQHADISMSKQAEIAISREFFGRFQSIMIRLYRWQAARAETAADEGDFARSKRLYRQGLRFLPQAQAGGGFPANDHVVWVSSQIMYWGMLQNGRENRSAATDEERAELEGSLLEFNADYAVFRAAMQDLYGTQNNASLTAQLTEAVWGGLALYSAVGIFYLAAIALFLGRFGRDARSPAARLGWIRHAMCWFFAIAVTVCVFGLAPAQIIPADIQGLTLVGALLLVIVGTSLFVASKLLLLWRKQKYRMSLRRLFVAIAVVAVVLTALPLIAPMMTAELDFLRDLSMPELGRNSHQEMLQSFFGAVQGSWQLAWLQWFTYQAHVISVAVALVAVAIWSTFRYVRRTPTPTETAARRWRGLSSGLFHSVGRSAFAVAVCCLAAYLWFLPPALQLVEHQFQNRMNYFRNPDRMYADVAAKIAEINADAPRMASIRAEVCAQMDENLAESEAEDK